MPYLDVHLGQIRTPNLNRICPRYTPLTSCTIPFSSPLQAAYLDWACLRICNTLGADFMPYLDFVMPPLLFKARLKPDLAILDSDDPNAGPY